MAAQEVNLGFFVGGLNTAGDPTTIGDNELRELVNFEVDIDGALSNRPPISALDVPIPGASSPGGGLKLLGYFQVSGGAAFLIASNRLNATYYFTGSAWTLITNTIAAVAMVQYRDMAWLLAPPSSANPGGKWSPTAAFTPEPNMPKGVTMVSFKDRIWIGRGKGATTDGTKLFLSAIVAGAVNWPTTAQFIDIGAGDGQNIVDIVIYQESILIFKVGSTYRFSFSTDPSLGITSKISSEYGANDTGCYAADNDILYVIYENKVLQFINYNFQEINTKVPLIADNPSVSITETQNISIWADRVFVCFYDKIYVYRTTNGTWCEWRAPNSVKTLGRVLKIPGQQDVRPVAYMYSTQPNEARPFRIYSGEPGTEKEVMTSYMVTKNFNFETDSKYKKLTLWVADLISRVNVATIASPVHYGSTVTWGALKASGRTWGQARAYTWANPLDISIAVPDVVDLGGVTDGRKLIKFQKILRFRQIFFRLSMTHDGSIDTAPVRVFKLAAWVIDKQRVTKRVS